MIDVINIAREFRRPKRIHGPFGGLRTFFTREAEMVRAVEDVSFHIDAGEVVGYLGANGAGKSTTIKMLSGILVPTSGEVRVNGIVPWENREENALNIGVVFGQRTQLWWDLPLIDSLRIIGKLYRMDTDRFTRNLARLDELLELKPFLDTPVRQLSLGQRMRGDLSAAMLYEPKILYLDEPTIGLDVVAKERMRSFIEQVNRESGTTIMLTTHDLADVERLTRRIIFIDKGRVLFDGQVAELKHRYAPYRELHVTLAPGADLGGSGGAETDTATTDDLPGVVETDVTETTLRVRFDPEVIAVADLIAAIIARYQVLDLAIVEPALESVVREIVQSGSVKA
ncbi:MAG: ATP-binding cassette domain-containing protein [Thermomicrobiales bacterium]|nr:ATP-binding cassette domain-containing protein [Thermomicrobiales bacterium]MCO5226539.1 ATP-binding cassette domain-containing protein [Thermomicrobiales bacterium]